MRTDRVRRPLRIEARIPDGLPTGWHVEIAYEDENNEVGNTDLGSTTTLDLDSVAVAAAGSTPLGIIVHAPLKAKTGTAVAVELTVSHVDQPDVPVAETMVSVSVSGSGGFSTQSVTSETGAIDYTAP